MSLNLEIPKPRPFLPHRSELPRLRRQPWKKLLYLNQPYPDNYTNESFLSQLKRNTTVVKYSYWKLVDDFLLIAQHLSNIFLVILIFFGIYYRSWNPVTPTIYLSVLTILGFVIWDRKPRANKTITTDEPSASVAAAAMAGDSDRSKVRSSIILIFILLILSPVLKSLTKSTASDSIWAISFSLCLANTLFHEYAMASDLAECKPIISTNISFSNAIVLASRLNSNIQVFCFVLTAIQLNILLPVFDVHLRQVYSPIYHRTLAFASSMVVGGLIAKILNLQLLFLWFLSQIGIVFILPFYFLFLQKYKNELQGPWDPAKPIIKSI